MNDTRRHHFIPVFYLKHFTDDNGFFYIFDVKKGKFKSGGRRFAPRTHFYEFDANTAFQASNPTDFIEKGFSEFDSKVGAIISKIRLNEDYKLTSEEWVLLQYFINILYWRNPGNTEKIRAYVNGANNLSAFLLQLKNRQTGERRSDEEERRMMTHPDFYKFARLILPAATYSEIFQKEVNDHAHIHSFPEGLPKLISDYPIIYRRPETESLHTDEFIFPLTPTKILFRHRYKALIIPSFIRMLIDTLLLMQAKAYVACTDLEYPFILKTYYDKTFTSIEHLRKTIFDNLYYKF